MADLVLGAMAFPNPDKSVSTRACLSMATDMDFLTITALAHSCELGSSPQETQALVQSKCS
ncbi:MAG: hypothetical protein OSB75_02930 [Dehalococcoidia bacterium]|nr:hypothetical protein [Dehalococcoidia bacterium]